MSKKSSPPFAFSFIRSGRSWFVANDTGRGVLLKDSDFRAFSGGRPASPAAARALREAGFFREMLDMDAISGSLSRRFLRGWRGPEVHIVSVTARCNTSCLYCGASSPRAVRGQDMKPAVADAVADFVFGSASPKLLIEFQGGEPLLNFGAVKRIVLRASARARRENREIRFSIVTNLSLMDEAKLRFLLGHKVTVCTSLDGPAALHDSVRRLSGGAHSHVARWLPRIAAEAVRGGGDPPNAVCTVTRSSLGHAPEIVDEFLRLGLKRVQLGPVDPVGLAAGKTGLSCSPEEFAGFYAEALDRMLALNRRGRAVYEKGARAFAAGVLRGKEPRYHNLDLARRIAYNWDGSVYGSDEARMMANSGDEFFRLGSVMSDTFVSLLRRPLARALLLSCFQGLCEHACARCPFSAYCRVHQTYNYAAQGSFWGDKATSERCALFKAVYGVLLERLKRPRDRAVLLRWADLED